MRRRWSQFLTAAFLLALVLVTGCGSSDSPAPSPGTMMLIQARAARERGDFTQATDLYRQARMEFAKEGRDAEALECLNSLRDIQLIGIQYPYSLDQTRTMLAAAFPQVPSADGRPG